MKQQGVRIFVSYSRADKPWFERLKVHLRPLARDHKIDVWEDTRIKPGSRWRDEVRRAVDSADAAILMISPDFLASEFIYSDELPPLLKAAEEEGTLILPIIISPSLFSRTPQLSQFQCVNDPARPLLRVDEGEREQTFVSVAEAILDLTHAHHKSPVPMNTDEYRREAFIDAATWTRLIKIGDWIFDKDNSRIIGSGMHAYLLSREEYGVVPFTVHTQLQFSNFEQHLKKGINKMNAGVVMGWNSDKPNPRYIHVMLTGEEVLIEKIGFNGGDAYRDARHLTEPTPLVINTREVYTLTIRADDDQIDVYVNAQPVQALDRPSGLVGRVGLRPWRSQMTCTQFVVSEEGTGGQAAQSDE